MPIMLVGAGGHARVCIDVIEQEGHFSIVGLIGQESELGTSILGYAVIGTDADLDVLCKKSPNILITIGQIKSPEKRLSIFKKLEQEGCSFPSIISPQAYVSPHASVAAGTIVMHGAIVNANAVIGRNCIINSQSLIEHDVIVGDHCHIATAAVVNGGVQIGMGTFIGSHSTVRQDIKIGERCVIGMGQLVLKDCEATTWMPGSWEAL
jgi:sugar O-acyltransferase (sialic acid O-acetyltransferase NeuD family)